MDVIRLVLLRKAKDRIGIYPQAVVGGEHSYEKRTEYMEGWNACAMQLTKLWSRFSLWFEEIPEKYKETVEKLLLSNRLELSLEGDEVTMLVNCNDLFYWACADDEEITLKELPDLMKAIKESPEHGDLLWCCRKRKMRPQTPYYRRFNEAEKKLFDMCGPERTNA